MPSQNSFTSTSSSSTTTSGHDRQPSVQLKIEAAGGPPNQQKLRILTIIGRNVRFILSQLSILISKSSPIVQTISVLLILLYMVQYSSDWVIELLVLSPGSLLSPGQWYKSIFTTITHPFVEFHWYSLIVDLISLSLCGTLIEPLWGHKEVIFFFTLVSIASAFLTCIHFIIIYTLTTDTALLFSTQIHGLSPLCAAMAVTVKQLLPQSVLISTSLGKLKNDHIPLTSLLLAYIAYIINIIEGPTVVMFSYGIIVSWIYLRFFQIHNQHNSNANSNSNTKFLTRHRGDLSDSFAFYTFFPNVLRPLVAIFADAVYRCFVKIGVCPDVNNTNNATYRLLSERLTNDINNSNNAIRVETL